MSLSKSDSDLNFKTKNEYADFIRVKKRKVNLPSKVESKGLKNGCNDLKIASVSRSLNLLNRAPSFKAKSAEV